MCHFAILFFFKKVLVRESFYFYFGAYKTTQKRGISLLLSNMPPTKRPAGPAGPSDDAESQEAKRLRLANVTIDPKTSADDLHRIIRMGKLHYNAKAASMMLDRLKKLKELTAFLDLVELCRPELQRVGAMKHEEFAKMTLMRFMYKFEATDLTETNVQESMKAAVQIMMLLIPLGRAYSGNPAEFGDTPFGELFGVPRFEMQGWEHWKHETLLRLASTSDESQTGKEVKAAARAEIAKRRSALEHVRDFLQEITGVKMDLSALNATAEAILAPHIDAGQLKRSERAVFRAILLKAPGVQDRAPRLELDDTVAELRGCLITDLLGISTSP
jgi:hypothetical protein